jgi:metal transporter CNNM
MESSIAALVCDVLFLPLLAVMATFVELKELIALHSLVGEYGGDLRSDTVTIIGATLDLQEKTTSHVRLVFATQSEFSHSGDL